MGLLQEVKAGVVSGNSAIKIFDNGKKNNYAIPCIEIINIDSINAVLETVSKSNSAIALQIDDENAKFLGGKISKGDAMILGATTTAQYIHEVASHYKIPVMIINGYSSLDDEKWLDELIEKNENFYKKEGVPLFTFHSFDISNLDFVEGIRIAQKYLKRVDKIGAGIEIKIDISQVKLKNLDLLYEQLIKVSSNFILKIEIKSNELKNNIEVLEKFQKHIKKEFKVNSKPLILSLDMKNIETNAIKKYINTGVVKIDITKEHHVLHKEALEDITLNFPAKLETPKKIIREIQKHQIKYISSLIKEFNSKNRL